MDIKFHFVTKIEVGMRHPTNANYIRLDITNKNAGPDGYLMTTTEMRLYDLPTEITDSLMKALPKSAGYLNFLEDGTSVADAEPSDDAAAVLRGDKHAVDDSYY